MVAKVIQQFALAPHDALFTAEALQMSLPDVGNQTEIGLCDRTEQGDLPAVAGSHFNKSEFGRTVHRQQCQRDTDVVVQVAVCGVCMEPAGQDPVCQLFGGRFPVAAGDGENWNTQLPAVMGRKLL